MATPILPNATASRIGFDLESGMFNGLTAMDCYELKTAYPDTNLDADLRQAGMWLLAHPDERPEDGGYIRFICKWLGNANDNAQHARSAGTTPAGATGNVVSIFAKRGQGAAP
jgi:hypothetical protein